MRIIITWLPERKAYDVRLQEGVNVVRVTAVTRVAVERPEMVLLASAIRREMESWLF